MSCSPSSGNVMWTALTCAVNSVYKRCRAVEPECLTQGANAFHDARQRFNDCVGSGVSHSHICRKQAVQDWLYILS